MKSTLYVIDKTVIADGSDVVEESVYTLSGKLLNILLSDHTTGKNILWNTDDYADFGKGFCAGDEMLLEQMIGKYRFLIQPRSAKARAAQLRRTRNAGEVFTQSWVCNAQNNLIDAASFHRKNVFNTEGDKSWARTKGRVSFSGSDLKWQEYIEKNCLEIACGEAPYLVSRYDAVNGDMISLPSRIGLLDRKLRIVGEHTRCERTWLEWAKRAFQSVYGYDSQGDNVLLARENLLFTFWDYYEARFHVQPTPEYLEKFAEIISWNIWQMDGLRCVVPGSCRGVESSEFILGDDGKLVQSNEVGACPGCTGKDIHRHTGVYCLIRDWRTDEIVRFVDLLEGREKK